MNVHSYRKLKKLSQEQLAEILDISVKHVSTIETGKVFASAALIEKIAETLNVSLSALFYTPEEKSLDDSDLKKIEQIIEEETQNAIQLIKKRIHTD